MTASITEKLAPVAPEFFVRNVDASIAFYIDVLGFTLVRSEPDGDGPRTFAVVARGDAEFLLAHEAFLGSANRAALPYPRASGVDIRLMVDDVDAVFARVAGAGARIVLPLKDQEYGLRDFIVADPDGFRIRFAQRIT
jgi:catechol 2,3-dioxygenase-like lactoylglutathione lyase family enzyme